MQTPKLPFEACRSDLEEHADAYVDAVFASLESQFLVLPRGEGFVDYATFERAYEALKRATQGFANLDEEPVVQVVLSEPVALVVLRAVLGFTPPEWAYVASQESGVRVSQSFARTLDRKARLNQSGLLHISEASVPRLRALVRTACQLLDTGAPEVGAAEIHRLAKADTQSGPPSLRSVSSLGVPYAMLLYERFLGRPFAGHRDSVSELIGGGLESAIEDVLAAAGVSYRKTKRAERIQGFDQAPDFVVPSEFAPKVVIEAKVTEDDGTARDKVTRVQHLAEISAARHESGGEPFEVVACIGGRGFGVRREDMRKLISATKGKVFTPAHLDRLVDCTGLAAFRAGTRD